MPKIKIPDVYIREMTLPPLIEAAKTSIAVFLGTAKKGPSNKPTAIQSFADFVKAFGGLIKNSNLGYALQLFFLNGGREAFVLRVPKLTSATLEKSLRALNRLEFNLLVLPGLTDSKSIAKVAVYCEKRRAFLIADAPAIAKTPQQMKQLASKNNFPKTSYAAIYYPWIQIVDALNKGKARSVPPSGAVAGFYAYTDHTKGVWKSPAGKEPLKGVQDIESAISDREQEFLNPLGVNVIRKFPNGITIWGARTLAAEAEYKYIAVRRLELYIEASIEKGTNWALFEPSGEALWSTIRLSIANFLSGLWRQGGLQGRTEKEAYFVKCDAQTHTQSDIDLGNLNIVIGFAPLKPAEFVVINLRRFGKDKP
jgi:uncharacterized protein